MSRHRKSRHPTAPLSGAAPQPKAPPPALANGASGTSGTSGASGASHDGATAIMVELRAALAALRRDMNARLDALDARLDALLPQHPAVTPAAPRAALAAPSPSKAVKVGDQVYVPRLGGTYTVVEAAPDGRAFKVQTGHLRVYVRSDELWRLDGAAEQPATPQQPVRPSVDPAIPDIDLHGCSEQEALVTLELFLHHAFTRRIARVRIIHGKGDGILRAAVRRELARNSLVRAVDIGPYFQGDDGVTLAELDV